MEFNGVQIFLNIETGRKNNLSRIKIPNQSENNDILGTPRFR